MISEIDLPTDAPGFVVEKETLSEPEKSETFGELLEKYDELYIKNSTDPMKEVEGSPLHKRSSSDDDDEKVEGESKSVIEKVENIVDPETRKEFELELPNSGKIADGELKSIEEGEKVEINEVSIDKGTEYDPNYDAKIVKNVEVASATVDSEPTDVLGRSDENIHTTLPLSALQVFDVVEEIFRIPEPVSTDSVPVVSPLNIQADFEPIEIATKSPESYRSLDVEATTIVNDKFVGFKPNEDLIEPGEETTEVDHFFVKEEPEEENVEKSAAEVIVDTLEFVGLYGKSLKDDEQIKQDETNEKELVEKISATSPIPETKTEIVEVNTEFSVSFKVDSSEKVPEASNSASEVSSQSSSARESSEEKESAEKAKEVDKNSSESSEENNAKEKFDKKEISDAFEKTLPTFFSVPLTKVDQNQLTLDIYKDTLNHEVIKKDHPVKTPEEIAQRSFDEGKVPEAKAEETTTVGVYETFEDVVSTVSDGVKLTNEFRSMIDSFRDNAEEIKTVLDTVRYFIS